MPTTTVDTKTTASTKKPHRQPVKHTKTFSGCWTCRERHVKCDESRPSCTRCRKAGVQCQGYGIKLVWIDPDTQEREQNIRRAIGAPAVYDDASSFMNVDVLETLDEIEQVLDGEEETVLGPFSVFAAKQTAVMVGSDGRLPESKCSPRTGQSQLPEQQQPMLSLPSRTGTGKHETADEEIETIMSPLLAGSTTLNRRAVPSNTDGLCMITRHLDLLPRPAVQRLLLHHWTSFVCRHLVPTDHPSNPFRSIFTPLALAGLQTPSCTTNGNIALFHALCATSAFSRSQLLQGDEEMLTLANRHYHLAIVHLRQSLGGLMSSNPSSSTSGSNISTSTPSFNLQRTSILATITAFSAMDMITGRYSEWRTHLQGGASWLSTLSNSVWQYDRSSNMVYQGYLAVAALCNIKLPTNLEAENEESFLDSRHYILDRFFGLTKPMLRHIVVMNSLIRRIATSAIAGLDSASLDELELQLYTQTPDNLDLSDLSPVSAALTRHHAYVFYYASLIFFSRTVRRLPPTSIQIQQLVEFAVGHLEEIEELGGESVGCTLVWPPFVVACECLSGQLQARMLAWYKVKQRHGFMNLDISKDIAKEVWRRRKELDEQEGFDKGDVQWQDVLSDLKMDIVLA